MRITLLVVGKTDTDYLVKGVSIYEKRIKNYLNFEVKVIPDIKNTRNLTTQQQSVLEGEQILSKISKPADTILLDEKGNQPTSKEFAELIEKKMISGIKELTFVVGGPYGFSPDVRSKISSSISLSRLTFSHQMVRLVFTEQLYRAMTIIRGEPYHHE
ncbi:MAG TPA: 23S rRNA (pseudouridine(1915)-N(3))-methyltransferase RlmH [Tenuifilaceae bacterium]|nr:23S rRNA (pseudouridine(1915)-N(3))-methyltransferase RlmH [Tenuifilaceae bacterium]